MNAINDNHNPLQDDDNSPLMGVMPAHEEVEFFICWQSKLTGQIGRGAMLMNYWDAIAEVGEANAQVPYIHHWVGYGEFDPDDHNCYQVNLDELWGEDLGCPF